MCGDGLAVALSKIQLCQKYTALGYYVCGIGSASRGQLKED